MRASIWARAVLRYMSFGGTCATRGGWGDSTHTPRKEEKGEEEGERVSEEKKGVEGGRGGRGKEIPPFFSSIAAPKNRPPSLFFRRGCRVHVMDGASGCAVGELVARTQFGCKGQRARTMAMRLTGVPYRARPAGRWNKLAEMFQLCSICSVLLFSAKRCTFMDFQGLIVHIVFHSAESTALAGRAR